MSINKVIKDRWSWKGYIPTAAGTGTSCMSFQRKTDEIMGRKVGITRQEKTLLIAAGIAGAAIMWAAVLLLYGAFDLLGGAR